MNSELLQKYPAIYTFLQFADLNEKDIILSLETKEDFQMINNLIEDGKEYLISDLLRKEYRDYYGTSFLLGKINDLKSSVLEYGLENKKVLEIMKTLDKNDVSFSHLGITFLENEKIDNDLIEKIMPLIKDKKYTSLIFRIMNYEDEDLDFLKKASEEESNERKILDFLIKKFDPSVQNQYYKFLEIQNRENFVKFISLMPNDYFNDNTIPNRLIKTYLENEKLMKSLSLEDINNADIQNKFKTYIMDSNRKHFKINDKQRLDNIKDIRYSYYKEKIESCEKITKIKSLITQNYFGIRYKAFCNLVKQIDIINTKCNILSEEEFEQFQKIKNIIYLQDKENLIYYYENMDCHLSLENLSKKVKSAYKEEIRNSLTNINSDEEIVYLDGESFSFFVHKIIGFGQRQIAETLQANPKKWFENAKEFVDVSYIRDDYMGVAPGNGYILILNEVKPSEIVSMGPRDIMTNYRNTLGEVKNLREEFMFSDDLIKNSNQLYNNLVIMKDENERDIPFIPTGILCFDEVDEISKNASSELSVPLVVVNRKSYIVKNNEKLKECLNNDDLDNYTRIKTQTLMSIIDNRELVLKYFSNDILMKETEELIKNTDFNDKKSLEKLSSLIKVNSKINSLKNFYDISYDEYSYGSLSDITKMLKK